MAGCGRRPTHGQPATGPYSVSVADVGISDDVLKGIARCQDALACYHWELYTRTHPELDYGDWERMLSCGRVREFMEHGVGVLYANESHSGEVVGYLSYSRLPPAPLPETGCQAEGVGAFLKINHIVVVPEHRQCGAGRLLVGAFLRQVGIGADLDGRALPGPVQGVTTESEPDVGVQIIAAELNEGAISWYRSLGFRAMNLHAEDCGERKICYVDLRRCWGGVKVAGGSTCTPCFCKRRGRLFGEELCGESVQVTELGSRPGDSVSNFQQVLNYDAERGLHLLEGLRFGRRLDLRFGIWVDLSAKFTSAGGLRFGRPLHSIVMVPKPSPATISTYTS